MKTIWKFPLQGLTTQLEMPYQARILSLQIQDGKPTLWAEVDTEAERETRTFQIKGTGHPLSDLEFYVGTFQDPPFVWHLYEEAHP